MRNIPFTAVAFTIAFSLCSTSAFASLIAFDGFEGNSVGDAPASGGLGWAGDWTSGQARVSGSGLSYSSGSIDVDGGSRSLDLFGDSPPNSTNFTRQLSSAVNADAVYLSFLFKAAETEPGNDFQSIYLSNTGSSGTSAARVNIDDGLSFEVRSYNGSGSQTTDESAVDAVEGTTYLVVLKLSKTDPAGNYNRAELFLDPSSTVEPATADAAVNVDLGVDTIEYVGFDVPAPRLTAAESYLYDNIRVSTDFVNAIPEPGSLSLLSLGALLLVRRR